MWSDHLVIYLNSLLFQNNLFGSLVYFVANPFAFFLFGIIILYFLMVRNSPRRLAVVGLVIISSFAISELLKYVFSYNRPFLALAEVTPLFTLGGSDSFPSGHATIFAALATAMYFEDKRLGIFFIISAVLIGLARVISGVHYAEDILAGFILGFGLVFLLYRYGLKLKNN